MDIHNLVVARYADGRVLKGVTRDFSALRPSFHVEVEGNGQMVEVRCRQLKAAFFVKAFDGYPERADLKGFTDGPPENAQGRKIAVRFRDGEFMCGYTMSWSPDREGFFIFPADPGSNNDRIYVVVAATNEVKAGPQAEALAQRVLAGESARGATGTPGTPATPPRTGGLGPRPESQAQGSSLGPRAPTLGQRPRSDAA